MGGGWFKTQNRRGDQVFTLEMAYTGLDHCILVAVSPASSLLLI